MVVYGVAGRTLRAQAHCTSVVRSSGEVQFSLTDTRAGVSSFVVLLHVTVLRRRGQSPNTDKYRSW